MSVTQDRAGPYAPPKAIIEFVRRYRSRGLPPPIDAGVLQRASIATDSLIPRTLQALQTLDLIDATGVPTETLEGIRRAPEGEYKARIAEWLNAAYADVLVFVDPATDDEIKVRDAFRHYEPVGQQDRMVTLFMGLYAEAGVGAPKPEKPDRPDKARVAKPSQRPSNPLSLQTLRNAAAAKQRKPVFYGGSATGSIDGLPPALSGLLASLPNAESGWTQAQRDKFMKTFGAVIDFVIPIISAKAAAHQAEEEEIE